MVSLQRARRLTFITTGITWRLLLLTFSRCGGGRDWPHMYKHTEVRLLSPLVTRADITMAVARICRKDLAWEDWIPGVCVHVCVMVVTVKMTGRSGESVNTTLGSVCVSMGFFSHVIMFKIWGRNAWGNCWECQGTLNLRCYATATLWHPNYDKITYSREKKTKPNIRCIWERSEKIIQHPLFPVICCLTLYNRLVCLSVCASVCKCACVHVQRKAKKRVFSLEFAHTARTDRLIVFCLYHHPLTHLTPHMDLGWRPKWFHIQHWHMHTLTDTFRKTHTHTNISHIYGSLTVA